MINFNLKYGIKPLGDFHLFTWQRQNKQCKLKGSVRHFHGELLSSLRYKAANSKTSMGLRALLKADPCESLMLLVVGALLSEVLAKYQKFILEGYCY